MQNKQQDIPQDMPEKKQPNPLKKGLRLLTYPLGIATAFFYGHKEARHNVEEFFKERGDFRQLDHDLETAHRTLKEEFSNMIPRLQVGRLSAEYAAKKTAILRNSGFKNTWHYLKANTGAEKANVFVSALGAAAIVVGLGSFLSEEKSQQKGLNTGGNVSGMVR